MFKDEQAARSEWISEIEAEILRAEPGLKRENPAEFSGRIERVFDEKYAEYLRLDSLLLAECRKFGFGKFSSMRVSQEFSIEHLYNINNNSYSVLIAGNGLNLDRATYTLPKTNWNSGIDYSTDNIDCEKVIYSYNKTITQDGTTDTAAEEIKVHNAVTTWATGGNLKHITAAAVGGAITGGLAAATCGMSLGAQITGSAMAGTAGYCAEKLVAREQGTATGMTSAAIGGAAGAMTGVVISGLTPKIASGFPKTASSKGKVNNAMSFAKGTTIKNVNGVDVIQDNNLINAGMIDARGRSNIERMSKGVSTYWI